MSKLMFYDLETTGLCPKKCAIHQLSFEIVINDNSRGVFDIRMAPFEGAEVADEAMVVGNVTKDIIHGYESQLIGYRSLISILSSHVSRFNKKDKMFLVGYNNRQFDDIFLREMFERNGDVYFGSWFWSNTIDVMVLAAQYLMYYRKHMENFKLKTVAATLGIEVDEGKLHQGNYDIELTKQIYYKVAVPPTTTLPFDYPTV